MSDTTKPPALALLSGDKTDDVDALAKLFERITGRKPTEKELSDAREQMGTKS